MKLFSDSGNRDMENTQQPTDNAAPPAPGPAAVPDPVVAPEPAAAPPEPAPVPIAEDPALYIPAPVFDAPPEDEPPVQIPEELIEKASEVLQYPDESYFTEEQKQAIQKVLAGEAKRKKHHAKGPAKADELYEFPPEPSFDHLEPPKRSPVKIALRAFFITLLAGALLLGGWYYWWTEHATFEYELKPVVIFDGQSIRPNDFLPPGEIQRGVNAIFQNPRFTPVSGPITVPLTLELGLRSIDANAQLYVLTPEKYKTHEYRSEAPDLTPMDFISNSNIIRGVQFELTFAEPPPPLSEFEVGVYTLQLLLGSTPAEVTLTVEDTTAPVAVPQDVTIQVGESVTPYDFVTDIFDHSEISYVRFAGSFADEPSMTALSEQIITVEIADIYGNTEEYAGSLTVLKNEFPPVFSEIPPIIESMADMPISYPEGITATDDFGREIEYVIDDSDVDTGKTGEYTVTYIAEDFSGLRTEIEATLFIIDVDPAEVNEWIDEKLDEILTDEMTQEEKVRAIFDTVRKTITYSTTTRTEWTGSLYTAAHYAINNPRGDYYHYYSLSELMMTRAGIVSMRIVRSEDTKSGKPHIWNLVYYDDSGWYHYDSTNMTNYTALNNIQHKFTQKQAAEIERQMSYFQAYGKDGFYDFDKEFYPDVVPE